MAQRRGFREYLAGLLAPRERNKTLTALAGAKPVTGSKLPAVQRLQFFLSESVWDPERVNRRRLECPQVPIEYLEHLKPSIPSRAGTLLLPAVAGIK